MKKTLFCFFMFFALFMFNSIESNANSRNFANEYPSYVDVCVDINASEDGIRARCPNSRGQLVSTSVRNMDYICSDVVVNHQGQLQCHNPEGSFMQTCNNIRTYNDELHADCQTMNGNWRATFLPYSEMNGCFDIENNNGSLQCTPF